MAMVENLLQALSLELSILTALLKRHKCSHGRAIYFRRMTMALKATQRLDLPGCWKRIQTLEQSTCEYSQRQQRRKNQRKRNRAIHVDQDWRQQGGRVVESQHEEQLQEEQALEIEFNGLRQTLLVHFPEILSRIDHASAPLFMEVSRGFFLPFCTVALAALARSRAIVWRIGLKSLTTLHGMAVDEDLISSSLESLINAMKTTFRQPKDSQLPLTAGSMENKEVTTQQLLTRIGLTPPSVCKGRPVDLRNVSKNPTENDMESTEKSGSLPLPYHDDDDGDGDDYDDENEKNKRQEFLSESTVEDQNDLGEAVAFDRNSVPKVTASMARRASTIADIHDSNMAMVASLKEKNKKKQNEKYKSENPNASKAKKKRTLPAPKGNAEKKQKKKKTKSRDFFDTLFD